MLACGCGDGEMLTAPTATATSPTTVTYVQLLSPGGAASRSFVATQAGTVSLTLQSAELPMGLGVGAPLANGAGCRASTSVVTSQGDAPQVTITVEAGTYCMVVFDVTSPGSRAHQLPVTVVLVHP